MTVFGETLRRTPVKRTRWNRIILMAVSVLLMFFTASCGSWKKIRFGSAGIGGYYDTTALTIAGFHQQPGDYIFHQSDLR